MFSRSILHKSLFLRLSFVGISFSSSKNQHGSTDFQIQKYFSRCFAYGMLKDTASKDTTGHCASAERMIKFLSSSLAKDEEFKALRFTSP